MDMNGVRINFNIPKVENNHILEYQNRFSHYNFSMVIGIPVVKRNLILEKIKNN